MPTSVLAEVAQAIADEINDHDFSLEIEAERSYLDWQVVLEDEHAGRVLVDVVGSELTADIDSRNEVDYSCVVDVGIRRKFRQEDRQRTNRRIFVGEVDKLAALQQEIFEYFMPATNAGSPRQLAALPEAVWSATRIQMPYIPNHLRELGQFTGIVSITYIVTRRP